MNDVEKLTRVILSPQGADDANLRLSRLNVSGEKAHFVAKIVLDAGYLPVEPAQLEALSDEEIFNLHFKTPYKLQSKEMNAYLKGVNEGMQATIEKNSKEQLYRRKE